MAEPLVPYLKYRVLHPVTGAELVKDLSHLNQDQWTVNFIQAGGSGTASVGGFSVPLHPPGSEQYKIAKPDYDKLDYGQRVEAYLGQIGGDPKFTGVIRKLPKDLTKYSISGEDSLGLLSRIRTHRTEYLSLSTDKLFKFALKGWSLVKGDDFSGDLSAYTNSSGWSIVADPDDATVKTTTNNGTGANKFLYSASYTNANYTDCFVEGILRVTMGTDASIAGEAALVAGLADTSNYIMGRAFVRYVTTPTTRWEIDTEIYEVVAGVATRKARVPLAIVERASPLKIQPQLIGKRGTYSAGTFTPDSAGADYLWRLVLNGYDGNCTWVKTGAGASTAGSVGFRWNANAGGSPQVWATQLCFANRVNFFQPGAITAGAQSIAQTFSEAAHIDIVQLAATTQASQFRKNPKAGLNNDTMDFGAVGSDLTPKVKFVEGENLVSLTIEPNALPPATDIHVQISPGPDAATLLWRNLGASGISKYGWLSENFDAQNLSDFGAARKLGKTIADLKAKPGTAKTMRVLRDASTADLWREGDTVEVTSPLEGLFRQAVLVQSFTFYGGQPYQDIIGDQYPLNSADYQLRQMAQTIERLRAGVAGVTPSGPSGVVYDNRYGTPYIGNFPSGLQPVDSTHPCRIIFFIPSNLLALQKVTVSFALVAFRSGKQATAAADTSGSSSAGTSGGGSSHTHNVADHLHTTPNHDHFLAANGGAGSAPTIWGAWNFKNAGGGATRQLTVGIAAATTDDLYTASATGTSTTAVSGAQTSTADAAHTHGMAHTHGIPSINLNDPNSVFEAGAATGATVILDGSTILAGPYNSDQNELDITQFVTTSGKHEVQITSTAFGGIFGHATIVGLVKAY